MTGARAVVELDDRGFLEAVSRLRAAVHDTTPIMAAIGVNMLANTQDRMDAAIDPEGSPF